MANELSGFFKGLKIFSSQTNPKEAFVLSDTGAPGNDSSFEDSATAGSLYLNTSATGEVYVKETAGIGTIRWKLLGLDEDIQANSTDISDLQTDVSNLQANKENIQRYMSHYISAGEMVLPAATGISRANYTATTGQAIAYLALPNSNQAFTTNGFILENWDEDASEIEVRLDFYNNGSSQAGLAIDCTVFQLAGGVSVDVTASTTVTYTGSTLGNELHDQSATFSIATVDGAVDRHSPTYILFERRGADDASSDTIHVTGAYVSWRTRTDAFDGVKAGTTAISYTNTLSLDMPGTSGNIASTGSYTDMSGHAASTISMWIKLDDSATGSIRHGVFYLGNSNANYYSAFFLPVSGSWRLYVYNNGAFKWYATYPDDNAWHHLAFIKNATSIDVYIDNSLVAPTFQTGTFASTNPTGSITSNFGIWGTSSANLYPLDGHIDEIALWDTNLSSGNISTLYANTDFANNVQPGNCINFWRMGDGDSLFTVTDQQGIANLTVGGGCTFVADVP